MTKRKLKLAYKRRPKEKVAYSTIIKEVEVRTGFKSCDINLVVNTFFDIMIETFLDKKGVFIKRIGTLYPFIRPERVGMDMNGMARVAKGSAGKIGSKENVRVKRGTKITEVIVPARYILKIKPAKNIVDKLLGIPISKEEIDNLYEKE